MSMDKIQVAAVNGTELHWREDGVPNGKPVVFSNSLGTDLRVWDAVIPLLPQGLRFIRFDNRGHGLSSCPPAPYSIDDLHKDTEQLLEQLGIKDCLFVGLSIGGIIGQSLAASRPDLIRALVLSNSTAKTPNKAAWQERISAIEANGIESIADAILERWFGTAFQQRPEATIWRNMLTRTPAEGYIGCCQAIALADLTEKTASLKLPAMGIGGSEDGASPAELIRATVDTISGSSMHVIEGVGHLPCVENPKAFAELMNNFIKEISHA